MILAKKILFTLLPVAFMPAALNALAAPNVRAVTPLGSLVPLTTNEVTLIFSEAMNPATVSSATVNLAQNGTVTNLISSCISKSWNNNLFACVFNGNLASNKLYNLTVTTGAQSAGGVSVTPYATNFATIARFAYVTDNNSNTVSVCPINADGTFGGCTNQNPNYVAYQNNASPFSAPGAVAINAAGTLAYVTNYGGNGLTVDNTVAICPIKSTGLLSSCTNYSDASFNGPVGITLNAAGTLVYVMNYNSSMVSVCPINAAGAFSGSCTSANPGGFVNPISIQLNNSGTLAYVTNANSFPANGNVSVCQIQADGTLNTCTTSNDPTFMGPGGLALNPLGTFAYVVNAQFGSDPSTVSMCPINAGGLLGSCSALYSFTFHQASFGKMTINAGGTIAYVVNEANGWVSMCPINSDGTFANCTSLIDKTFYYSPGNTGPQGIALL